MRRELTVLSAVLAGAMMVGCGGSKAGDKTTTSTARATTSTTAVAASPEAVALESRLIKAIPAGYVQEDDRVGDTGPSDLAKAVRDDGGPNAEAVLTEEGFVAGYQRLWTHGADDSLIDFVYQFKTATGAQRNVKRLVEAAAQGDESNSVTEFTVTGVPGAKGFLAHSTEGNAAIVAFAAARTRCRLS